MSRTVRDYKLETKAARLKLKAQKEPYWRNIDMGLHLGYAYSSMFFQFITNQISFRSFC